eukprot:CAMPEP_0117883156 /NCGR_PEP_ID=MMETSP0950-20121206/17932_1 /TAXON_ID=44440 /ORGANISM="Chattonella subsalsa, Strain CCMP2191" /LENGTH=172 /DNA_ID=CAMNT_0005738909 /DNA_START=280 /DNA_END=795 /DNA_ORIENTATION=+
MCMRLTIYAKHGPLLIGAEQEQYLKIGFLIQKSLKKENQIQSACLSAMNKTGLPIIYEENDLCNTVKNIRKIATAFRDQGKKVVICDVMTSGAGLETHKGVIKRLNRQIKQVVTDTEGLKLVQLSDAVISRDMNRGFDGLHLNYKGYKIFAKKIFECIQGDLVAAEFNVWRP